MPIVTLIADFGMKGPYAAMVKGVMLKINPSISCVDVSGELEVGDIGEIIYIDKFGNLISNIKENQISGDNVEIEIKGLKILNLSKKYSEGSEGKPIALVNNVFETLEVSLNKGDAASFFDSRVGDKITLRGKYE